jgi:rSAM/selenodomain-associated transferase 2
VIEALRGRARQQNAGARAAAGDWLLFLHADNWLSPDALHQLRQAAAHGPARACAFRQAIAAPGLGFRLLEWGNARRVRWWRLPYGDQGLALMAAFFAELGGFPDVPLMEDVLLMRAARRRTPVLLLPGPLHVDARRWQRYGVIRQTARNWLLLSLFRCGVSPQRLARLYPHHDQTRKG